MFFFPKYREEKYKEEKKLREKKSNEEQRSRASDYIGTEKER